MRMDGQEESGNVHDVRGSSGGGGGGFGGLPIGGRGQAVGELALLTDSTRTASVRARRDSELLRVSRDAFDSNDVAFYQELAKNLVAGGNDGLGEANKSFIYDPLSNTWTSTAPNPRADPTRPSTCTPRRRARCSSGRWGSPSTATRSPP